MSVQGDNGVLERAARELTEAWHATENGWRDQARDEFGREHLEQLTWRARHAERALSELMALCAEAERACQ
ncbi:MAG TPA: hypothetical protein DCS97_05685 [Planctomycetes bacterium]|jgi:hypothetical protein|nr:hypothetical protein [Planctomycetota bacterium]